LDNHVLLVVGVLLDHRKPKALAHLLDLAPSAGDHLLKLSALVRIELSVAALQQLLRTHEVALRPPVLLRQPVRLLELTVVPRESPVAIAVGDRLRVRELLGESAVPLLDLVDQPLDHLAARFRQRLPCRAGPPRSTRPDSLARA